MLKLSKLGVSIVPAMPGFYHQPASIADLVDMMVMKVMDQMGIHRETVPRWGSDASKDIRSVNPAWPVIVPLK
jgi:4-hydroxy-3-polyprenylbenzoate decarboxylase